MRAKDVKFIPVLLGLSLILFLSPKAKADEGYRTRSRITSGSIYAPVEHPEIALEKEVLVYQGDGNCEVHFLFKNNAPKTVVVEAGFPVKIVVPLKEIYLFDRSRFILEKIYEKDLFPASRDEPFFSLDPKNFNRHVKRVISWNEFKQMNLGWTGKKSDNITITQNGKDVNIDSVWVEAQVIKGDTVLIHLHFLHQLSFQPNSFSNVLVKYSSASLMMYSGDPFFARYIIWRYVLGTGRTWQGPIKTIYLLVPDHLIPELPKPFVRVGDFRRNAFFMAQNYEPLENDEIQIRYLYFDLQCDCYEILARPVKQPQTPVQRFVVLRNTSSYLPQRTWVNALLATSHIAKNDPIWNSVFPLPFFKDFHEQLQSDNQLFYVAEGNVLVTCRDLGFEPLSLFDGIPESAWCEGVKGDGINQWVEFELKEDVLGLAIHNGFKKVRYLIGEENQRAAQLEAVYSNNNRVKILEFVSGDGKITHTLELKDTPEKQSFKDVYMPKGIYKLYIRDVYKGTKYDDTCLGEIEFYSASAQRFVDEDGFLKEVLARLQIRAELRE